jgi:hypothetical protein
VIRSEGATMVEVPNPVGEMDDSAKLTALLAGLQREYAPQLRGMHPKTVACLAAEFRVLDALPQHLAHGLFASPHTYTAWVRFSNAVVWDDREPDLHGLALKLLGVPGAKVLRPSESTDELDLLLIDAPVFFTPDVAGLYGFLSRRFGLEKSGKSAEEVGRTLASEYPRATELFMKVARPSGAPLETGYWSCVPFELGPHVVKYSIQPRLNAPPSGKGPDLSNGARATLVEWLTRRGAPAYFDVHVQLREDPATMPIDDATVEWSSPYHKVAELLIAPQTFDTPERDALGERLVFNPWHTLPEHAPLGGLNRARLPAYLASAQIRHETNPTGTTKPPG